MRYIRASDRTAVSQAEACLPGGQVRSGFSAVCDDGEVVGFSHSLMDSAGGGRVTFRDTAVTLTDAEAGRAVALAKRQHDTKHAYMGSRAPAFTDAQAAVAAAAATARKQAVTPISGAVAVRDAATAAYRVRRDDALAARTERLRNAWKGNR